MGLLIFLISLLMIYGYVMNFVTLIVQAESVPMKIIRLIGVFIPVIGIAAGFID